MKYSLHIETLLAYYFLYLFYLDILKRFLTQLKINMNIHIFGTNTPSGQALKNEIHLSQPEWYINTYSRDDKSHYKLDLNDSNSFTPANLIDKSIWISFAPIWLFGPFLENLSKYQPYKLKGLEGVIACSSSSIITKRFEANKFDEAKTLSRLRTFWSS